MRLPDFSEAMQQPTPEMNPDERGRLLLQYVSARRSVQGLDFRTAALRTAQLSGAQLSGVELTDADLFSAELKGATLAGAVLERASLHRAKLVEADLRNARMSNAQLESAQLMGADLRFADLNRARLQYANLHRANLQQADLRDAILQRARLRQADLRGADLRGADLRFADLFGADLRGAHLDEAGARRSGFGPTVRAALQAQGLVISDQPPEDLQSAVSDAEGGATQPGLLLRTASPTSAIEAALIALVVASWRGGEAAVVDLAARPLMVVGPQPAVLGSLVPLLQEGRWGALGLPELLQPAALEALSACLAGASFELWGEEGGRLQVTRRW
jgi:uncharacterized protein YjbI with pentapeptide repeats